MVGMNKFYPEAFFLFHDTVWVSMDCAIPPVPEKLYLEVGTPWVDRVYDRKSVPGFFVI